MIAINHAVIAFVLALLAGSIYSLQEAQLSQLGYNYVSNIVIDSESYPLVMDTGSSELLSYNRSYENVKGPIYSYCLALVIDSTPAQFASQSPYTCEAYDAEVRIGPVVAENVLANAASSIGIGNPQLHQWYNASGVFGLSYNQSCFGSPSCGLTAFQEVLSNASTVNNNLTFGLDFRNPKSPITSITTENSSMQLGGVKAEYEDSLTWLAQPLTPSSLFYHLTQIQDLQLCGKHILGNFSTNWPVIIDTGSSCLTLPGEIYDNMIAWFNTSNVVNNLADLPALTFRLNTVNRSQEFYIPLGVLAVDYNAIEKESGAPVINYQGSITSKRICVLRGGNIESGGSYNNPPSTISFGSLVLQSLYFGADFSQGSTAFDNKLSPSEIAYYQAYSSNGYCSAATICKGQQVFTEGSNACNNPNCDKYFFVTMDNDRKVCVYKDTPMVFGIVFVSIIIAAEVLAFLLQQYSGYELAARQADTGRGRTRFTIDYCTLFTARIIVQYVDYLLVTFARRPSAEENPEDVLAAGGLLPPIDPAGAREV